MRGREDHAAANQRSVDALSLARRRAVAECQGQLRPKAPGADRTLFDDAELYHYQDWERLNVEYLKAEWPPSKLC
jgi:hypothetical protein